MAAIFNRHYLPLVQRPVGRGWFQGHSIFGTGRRRVHRRKGGVGPLGLLKMAILPHFFKRLFPGVAKASAALTAYTDRSRRAQGLGRRRMRHGGVSACGRRRRGGVSAVGGLLTACGRRRVHRRRHGGITSLVRAPRTVHALPVKAPIIVHEPTKKMPIIVHEPQKGIPVIHEPQMGVPEIPVKMPTITSRVRDLVSRTKDSLVKKVKSYLLNKAKGLLGQGHLIAAGRRRRHRRGRGLQHRVRR